MKSTTQFIFAAALLTLLVFYFLPRRESQTTDTQTSAPHTETNPTKATHHPARPSKKITLISTREDTQLLGSKNESTQKDIETLDGLIRLYRQAMKGNPVGLNEEITAALVGRNKKGIAVLPKNHPAISPTGELIDRWGSPYFFHAISGTHMEIRSSGPDRKRYTKDDILSHR